MRSYNFTPILPKRAPKPRLDATLRYAIAKCIRERGASPELAAACFAVSIPTALACANVSINETPVNVVRPTVDGQS